MPMNEYFHKVYIMKEVPRSVTLDMRMALRDGRAPRSYEREWAPYDGVGGYGKIFGKVIVVLAITPTLIRM